MKAGTICLGLVFYVLSVESINILCLMPVASPSHHFWNRAIMNGLAEKGYNLTILDTDVDDPLLHPNMHYIHLENSYNVLYEEEEGVSILDIAETSYIDCVHAFHDFSYLDCQGAFNSNGFKTLLNYPKDFKFDLVLYDFTTGGCMLGFMKKFNYPPLVGITPFNNPPFTHHIIGGHKYYAYIPYYGLKFTEQMSFYERAINTFIHLYDDIYRIYKVNPDLDKMMKKNFNDQNLPYVGDLEKLTRLILVNSHPSIDFPEPAPSNLFQVGGLQIQQPKPLPTDILQFIEKSNKGCILFALGGNVKSSMLSKETHQIFIEVFRKLPMYNFLWKFETNFSIDIPKNVLIRTWLPQTDILAHPNIKAFISHSGLLSTHEAVWFGVPVISIPFYLDQNRNSHRIVQLGIGKYVDFRTITFNDFKEALLEVLENPSYSIKAKDISNNFKDQPIKALDLAVWWCEWVIRNPNTTFLKSPSLDLGWFRSNSFDVFIFLILIPVIFLIYLLIKIVSAIKRRKTNRSENSQRGKKND